MQIAAPRAANARAIARPMPRELPVTIAVDLSSWSSGPRSRRLVTIANTDPERVWITLQLSRVRYASKMKLRSSTGGAHGMGEAEARLFAAEAKADCVPSAAAIVTTSWSGVGTEIEPADV